MVFGKTAYVLEQVKDGLKDPDGTILYEPANQNLRIPKEMDQIAELANFYSPAIKTVSEKTQSDCRNGSGCALGKPAWNGNEAAFKNSRI